MKGDIMEQQTSRTADFWVKLENDVSSKVDAALNADKASRDALISYLRDLEAMVRTECDRRQTVQIIASGRRLLGDKVRVGPNDGPFSRAVA